MRKAPWLVLLLATGCPKAPAEPVSSTPAATPTPFAQARLAEPESWIVAQGPKHFERRPHSRDSVWHALLAEAAPDAPATAAMECVAREIAKLELDHSAAPTPAFERFLLDACRSTGVVLRRGSARVSFTGTVSDESIIDPIRAQLVEVETENQVWAERYDRELKDIFEVQDEVTRSIVAVLPGRVQEDVVERAARKHRAAGVGLLSELIGAMRPVQGTSRFWAWGLPRHVVRKGGNSMTLENRK